MPSPHDEFPKLRKLLSYKRYEQPPPGYFDELHQKVIGRLEAEELVEYSSWWRWLVEKFDAKPVLVCVYGVVISGLLLAGFRLSQIFEGEVAATPIFSGPSLALTPGSNSAFPEDLDQSNSTETSLSTFAAFSKNAYSVFGQEPSPVPLNEASGLRFSPISPAVTGR